MLYIKFNIQSEIKYVDFQKLYNHMVQLRQPGFKLVEDAGPEFEWEGMTKEQVDAAVAELNAFLDTSPEVHRYNKFLPSYANEFLENFVKYDNEKLEALGVHNVISIFNYLEYGFEVDMDNLERINEQLGIVEFSTGNYPFGGMERFIIVLRAFDLIPTTCYDGFKTYEFEWVSNFEYQTRILPEHSKNQELKNANENTDNLKKRHGCLKTWLILMSIFNAITVLSYILIGNMVS